MSESIREERVQDLLALGKAGSRTGFVTYIDYDNPTKLVKKTKDKVSKTLRMVQCQVCKANNEVPDGLEMFTCEICQMTQPA